jgi:hypothetical protein
MQLEKKTSCNRRTASSASSWRTSASRIRIFFYDAVGDTATAAGDAATAALYGNTVNAAGVR